MIVLKRGSYETISNPSKEIIAHLLRVAPNDGLAPDFYIMKDDGSADTGLMFFCTLFGESDPPSWNVAVHPAGQKRLLNLATQSPSTDAFVMRTRSGCVELFRRECAIQDHMLILKAVDRFLIDGNAAPELIWLSEAQAVRTY